MPSFTFPRTDDDAPRNGNAFLLYHGKSHVTGQRLGDYLGVPNGRDCNDHYDYLIRWGNRGGAGFRPNNGVLNSMSALNDVSDKLDELEMLESGGIPVPDYTTDRDEIADTFGYPALGRDEDHSRGEDIELILQWRDTYLTDSDYYVEYLPTEFEYRMHVVNGEVVKVHEKRLRSEEDNHPFIRNSETGWVFLEPDNGAPPDSLAVDAVGTLGLDFGAVDVIREEGTDDYYVLEVNTAPSLDEANLERYADAFAEWADISSVPGLDAVDFDEEPEEEPEGETADVEASGSSLFESDQPSFTESTQL